MAKTPARLLLIFAPALGVLACERPPKDQLRPGTEVLATVNGAPITAADVQLRVKTMTKAGEIRAENTKNIVDVIIRQEVAAQRAAELGLDKDATYLARLADKLAEVEAYRRGELSEALVRRDLAEKTQVSDAEVQKYFDENQARIRTEVHVFEILRRDETSIQEAKAAIAGGKSFEEVAAGLFPETPEGGRKPWDVGYLAWKQLPEPWVPVLDKLKAGEVSDVVRGPGNRFWLVKLIDRRENPAITLETAKPVIVDLLKAKKAEARRPELEEELRKKANIQYFLPAPKP